jgi:molecular chaperone GrpE (heat shock protein)
MSENTANPNTTLIEEVLQLMDLSSMDQEERTMWTIMLPSLETAEIKKIKATLEQEVQKMTDIYLKAQAEMSNKKNPST